MKPIIFLAAASFLLSGLPAGSEPLSTEGNAVLPAPKPFTLTVSELSVSGFASLAPNGSKQNNNVTSQTVVMQGDKSAVFGDIGIGDLVTGTRTMTKPDGSEWEIMKISSFVSRAEKTAK